MRLLLLSLVASSLACTHSPTDSMRVDTRTSDGSWSAVAPSTPEGLSPGQMMDRSAWAQELRRLDAELDALTARAQEGDDWTRWEQVALLGHQRARLSGNWRDYDRAEAALESAFALAPSGSGPHRSAGALDYSLHRYRAVKAHLDEADATLLNDHPTQAGLRVDRALLHLQTGEVETARRLLADARDLHVDLTVELAEALVDWRTGNFDEADRRFAAALDTFHGASAEPVAWLHLQRGLLDLDRGRDAEAAVHYAAAETALDGWWLVEEHLAELDMRSGRWAQAESTLTHVVETTGGPEYMSMLAEVRLAQGDAAGAQDWADRATDAFREDAERYPEATAGHALDHALAWESPEAALRLAELNVAAGSNAAALAGLAEALLGVDRLDDAKEAIDAALATGEVAADLHRVQAEVYAAMEQTEAAAEAWAAARAIDPTI